ncbi:hypothetical protein BV900_24730 [Agrobacterium tumefaciens]|nr:hypothetical protein BV900_24730 [Agrobacterium tumefaciens]
MGQYEDWWYLIQNDDGTIQIEHESDYVRVNGLSRTEGSKLYSLDEGLKVAPHDAAKRIREILGL